MDLTPMNVKKNIFLLSLFIAIFLMSTFIGMAQEQTNFNAGVRVLPQSDSGVKEWKDHEFLSFDHHYKEELAKQTTRTGILYKQVVGREIAGQQTGFSHQILAEIIWLISSTADFKRINTRLNDLQTSLDHPENELGVKEQDSTDGSWGKGYNEWIFKVIASYPHLKDAKYALHFIDRINSPQKLTDYFTSISVSNIALTGIDHEREFNESISNLMRMILRHRPKQYAYDPKLKKTLMDLLLNRFRNPVTGYWGESYVRNGPVEFVDDLSITFHVVSYLEGNVPDMNKVIATTLAAKDLEFPVGPLYQGQHYDHLNLDVAELFRLGWPYASDEQKKAIAIELHKLLECCLTGSLQTDGSFKMWVGDNSKEESTYYGAAFLARIGYFDKSKRFWTEQDFPEAETVRQKIIAYIEQHLKSGATGGDYYESALEELNKK